MRARLRIFPLILAAAAVGLPQLTSSCSEEERAYVPSISDPEHMPTMRTVDVTTLISDSGYTRYKITAPLWLMYDEASDPHWRFPDGLFVQQYDEQFHPSAKIYCDSAIYFSQKRLWRLDGDVMMVNTLRDTFLTEQLFWDQSKQKVYSDSFIHIVREDRIIEGYGFESNENMTRFNVKRTQAIIPSSEMQRNNNAAQPDTLSDTMPVVDMNELDNRRRKGAPKRASERAKEPKTLTL